MSEWHELNKLEKEDDELSNKPMPMFLKRLFQWVIKQCRLGKQDIAEDYNERV